MKAADSPSVLRLLWSGHCKPDANDTIVPATKGLSFSYRGVREGSRHTQDDGHPQKKPQRSDLS